MLAHIGTTFGTSERLLGSSFAAHGSTATTCTRSSASTRCLSTPRAQTTRAHGCTLSVSVRQRHHDYAAPHAHLPMRTHSRKRARSANASSNGERATGDGRARRCARAQPGGAHRLQELCIRPAVSNACLMHQLRRKCDWSREPLLPACMAVRSASSVHVCSIEPHPVTRDVSPSGSIAVVFLLDASARLGKAS